MINSSVLLKNIIENFLKKKSLPDFRRLTPFKVPKKASKIMHMGINFAFGCAILTLEQCSRGRVSHVITRRCKSIWKKRIYY